MGHHKSYKKIHYTKEGRTSLCRSKQNTFACLQLLRLSFTLHIYLTVNISVEKIIMNERYG